MLGTPGGYVEWRKAVDCQMHEQPNERRQLPNNAYLARRTVVVTRSVRAGSALDETHALPQKQTPDAFQIPSTEYSNLKVRHLSPDTAKLIPVFTTRTSRVSLGPGHVRKLKVSRSLSAMDRVQFSGMRSLRLDTASSVTVDSSYGGWSQRASSARSPRSVQYRNPRSAALRSRSSFSVLLSRAWPSGQSALPVHQNMLLYDFKALGSWKVCVHHAAPPGTEEVATRICCTVHLSLCVYEECSQQKVTFFSLVSKTQARAMSLPFPLEFN